MDLSKLAPVLLWVVTLVASQTDRTVVENANGHDVVDAVIRKMSRARVFNDDNGFLKRLALVESEFGTADYTFEGNNQGGIWQVDQAKYAETKDSSLSPLHDRIFLNIVPQINWTTTQWSDLRKPLYSGIAARLFLFKNTTFDLSFPRTLSNQTEYWNQNYNDNSSWTGEYFRNRVLRFEEISTCEGRLDLSIVLDGSGSVGFSDFQRAKQFVGNLVSTFSLNHTRIGFIVYSTRVRSIFPIENNLTDSEMQYEISKVLYPNQNTYTGEAMLAAISDLKGVNETRPGVPRLIAIFTDGRSNGHVTVSYAASQAAANKIITYAIGIGSGIEYNELLVIAQNNPDNVFLQTGYEELSEFFHRLNQETCEIPQTPEFNYEIVDTLIQNEKRYYSFSINGTAGDNNGLTVRLRTLNGNTRGFYAYQEENPSSAYYDGTINGNVYVPRPNGAGVNETTQVYIAVEGLQQANEYSIEVLLGNHVPNSAWKLEISFKGMFLGALLFIMHY